MNFKRFFTLGGLLFGLMWPMTGMNLVAWKTIVLFLFAISNLLLKVFDMGTMSLIIITAGALSGAFSIQEAISSFGAQSPWQIISVFFLARGIIKTRLSERIAFYLIRLFGSTTLGLSYGLGLANYIIGPLIPSSTARMGVIFLPILQSIFKILKTHPEDNTQEKAGTFLVLSCLYTNTLVASTFLTAMAGNFIIQTLAGKAGFQITWFSWFYAAIIPSIFCVSVLPLLIYALKTPELKNLEDIQTSINQELSNLGKISNKELTMIATLFLILTGWMTEIIHPLLVTFSGICLLIILDILDFEKDITENKEAWNTLIWVSTLIMLGQKLDQSEALKPIIDTVSSYLVNYSMGTTFALIVFFYAYSHYVFASLSSHISALYSLTLALCIQSGLPPLLAVYTLAFVSNLFAGLTKYASTEALILSKMNYVSESDFLKIGFISSSLMTIIWLSTGLIWWKIIGLY